MKAPYHKMIIGGSAGSLMRVLELVTHMKRSMELMVILVFHRKSDEDSLLTELISARTELSVKEIEEKELLQPGVIYIAPSDYHILIEKDGTISLDDSEKINFSRPSIDVAFESGADAFGDALVCMLLSGANADGVEGLMMAQQKGSLTVVQDPDTAEVSYMPQQALDNMIPDVILFPNESADFVHRFLA